MSNIQQGSVRVTVQELIQQHIAGLQLDPGVKVVGASHLLDPVQGIVEITLQLSVEEVPEDE